MTISRVQQTRHIVRYFYDLQKLRIQASNRDKSKTVELDDADKQFLSMTGSGLKRMEKDALNEIKRLLHGIPIYDRWLEHQLGCGPTMSGVLLGYVNIEKCSTVSQLWAWCGLAVRDGVADRRVKGQRARYNPWLKSKVLAVLGSALIKAVGKDEAGYYTQVSLNNKKFIKPEGWVKAPAKIKLAKSKTAKVRLAESKTKTKAVAVKVETEVELPEEPDTTVEENVIRLARWDAELDWDLVPASWEKVRVRRPLAPEEVAWREFYDNYKHRKESERVPQCAGCKGTGKYKVSAEEIEKIRREVALDLTDPEEIETRTADEVAKLGSSCTNCGGTGGPAPWGRSKQHRHMAAMRYMVKMFLRSLHIKWRSLENLPIRQSYEEQYLGMKHSKPHPAFEPFTAQAAE